MIFQRVVKHAAVLAIALAFLLPSAGTATAKHLVRVGVYQNPPILSYDSQNTAQGFFVDLLHTMAREEGWALEFVPGSWDECLQRLQSGGIDLLPAIAYTPDREKLYRFTEETVLSNWGQVYSRTGSKIQSILDLDGKTVAVMWGDVHYQGPLGLKTLAEKFSLNIRFVEVQDYADALKTLAEGRADAGLVSRLFLPAREVRGQVVKTPIVLNPVSVRMAFPPAGDPALKEACDRQIARLKNDPQSPYYQVLARWIGGGEGYGFFTRLLPWLKVLLGALVVLVIVTVLSRFQVRRGLREISRKNRQLEEEVIERRQAQQALARQTSFFEAALNSIPDGMVLCNTEREIVRCNPAMVRIFGFQPQDLLGSKTAVFYASQEEFERQGAQRFNLSAEQKHLPYVVTYRRKDGTHFPGETLGTVVKSDAGEVLGYLGVIRDITARQQAQKALQWELEVNQAIASLSRLLLTSSSLEEISNAILEEAKNLTDSPYGFIGFIDPVSGDMISPTLTRDIWEECQVPDKKFVFHKFQGLWGWVLTHKESILCNDPKDDPRSTGIPEGHVAIHRFLGAPALADGSLLGMIAMANANRPYHDKDRELLEGLAAIFGLAVQNMRKEQILRQSEERFRAIFENAGAGMNTIDIEGRYLQVNLAFCRFTGYAPEEFENLTVEDLTFADDIRATRKYFSEVREGRRKYFDYQKRFVHRSGRVVWGHVTTVWMLDEEGEPLYGVGLVQDITERKKAEARLKENEERLKHLAHHDRLTELPNRVLFADRLQQGMLRARRTETQIAVLFFDLDRFKEINDTHGHEMGDQILQAMAGRLKSIIRGSDTVARFGGDEFIVLLEGVTALHHVEALAGKILNVLAEPLSVGGHTFQVTSSIGISLFPADGEDEATLVRKADDAMFRAKKKGRNLFVFANPEDTPSVPKS